MEIKSTNQIAAFLAATFRLKSRTGRVNSPRRRPGEEPKFIKK